MMSAGRSGSVMRWKRSAQNTMVPEWTRINNKWFRGNRIGTGLQQVCNNNVTAGEQ